MNLIAIRPFDFARLFHRFTAVLLLPWIVGAVALAETGVDPYAEYQGRFRMGMEIELQPSLLKSIVHVFDWESVEKDIIGGKTALPPDFEREYNDGKVRPLGTRSADFLSRLAIDIANWADSTRSNYPPLRKNLPPTEAAIFAGLKWHNDNDKLEFTHANPLTDPKEYLAQIRRFAAAVGITKQLDSPLDKRRNELSYHLHFSRVSSNDVSETLATYNRLMLMRLVQRNGAEELFRGNRVSKYSENLHNRGIVRQISPSHFELRRHLVPPEAELLELMKWFGQTPAQAKVEIAEATQDLLTDRALGDLAEMDVGATIAVVGKTSQLVPPKKVRTSLQNPVLMQLVLRDAVPFDRLNKTTTLLKALVANAEGSLTGAREMLAAFSNRLQSSIDPPRLERWIIHSSPEQLQYLLNTTADHATTPGPKHDLTHPDVGWALNASAALNRSHWDVANFYAHFAEKNAIAKAGLYERLAAPSKLQDALITMVPCELFSSPDGWRAFRTVVQHGAIAARSSAIQRLVRDLGDFTPEQLAEAYAIVSQDSSSEMRRLAQGLSRFAEAKPKPPPESPPKLVDMPKRLADAVAAPKPKEVSQSPSPPQGWLSSLAGQCQSLLARVFGASR